MVRFSGIPSKVGQAVISRYSVVVTALHTFRTWSNKSLKHKAMNGLGNVCKIDIAIAALFVDGSFNNTSSRNKATLITATSYAAFITNFTAVNALDRSPLFGSEFFGGKFRFSHDAPLAQVAKWLGPLWCFNTKVAC